MQETVGIVEAGRSREWDHAVQGTGFADVRGTSPFPRSQRSRQGS